MRSLAQLRFAEFERELEPRLVRFAVANILRRMEEAGQLSWSKNIAVNRGKSTTWPRRSRRGTAIGLVKSPSLEDVTALSQDIVTTLVERTLHSLLRYLFVEFDSFDVSIDRVTSLKVQQSFLARRHE